MKVFNARLAVLAATLAVLPQAVSAHTLGAEGAGFAHGFLHPVGGWDHLLAMIAVGLWAAQRGGRALWVLPAAFVGSMILGGAVGMAGIDLPQVELGIVASVIVLGALIALQSALALPACVALVGLFGVFHGHAHGMEMPVAAAPVLYGLGFALATALLHASGIGLALASRVLARESAARLALRGSGALVGVAGLALVALG